MPANHSLTPPFTARPSKYTAGLYRYDTTLIAVGYKIGDGFTLLAGLPLLLVPLWLYRRGSLRGGILLAGMFAYLLYTYSSLVFGAAYNNLLLVYIALTAATLLGVAISARVLTCKSIRVYIRLYLK
jgi:hypothetical protein